MSLQKLKKFLIDNQYQSRFLTLGFTSSHDAPFLNQITQTGSELGNFFYINTDVGDYSGQISECLSQSVSMAGGSSGTLQLKISSKTFEYNEKLNLQKSYVLEETKESDNADEDMN